MFPKYLLNSDDDWQEDFRRHWYPWLHPRLSAFGDQIGINLYAHGSLGSDNYVGTLPEGEETIEKELEELGFVRNPIAAFKETPDGRLSEGSWVLLESNDEYDLVDHGMQLHITLFEPDTDEAGRELWSHYEDDWRVNPLDHLRANNFSPEKGVEKTRRLIGNQSYLQLQ